MTVKKSTLNTPKAPVQITKFSLNFADAALHTVIFISEVLP